jgi:DNA repair exonuclease SbcCD ATPase subunit
MPDLDTLSKHVDLTIGDDAIAEMAEKYLVLTVQDVNDKPGLAAVHEARRVVKRTRVEIEKTRKGLNEDALAWQRTVNTEAKRLTALLTPIENHLEHEEGIVAREKERLRAEEEAKRLQAEKKARDEAAAIEAAERAKVAEEQRHEAERLAAERAELDRVRKEQAEAQAKIDAENKRISDEHAARERAAELEKAKAEAAEREKREAEELRRRQDALRPDYEKLFAIGARIDNIDVPVVSAAAAGVAEEIRSLLRFTADRIEQLAKRLVN